VHARSEIGGSEREVRALNEIRDSNELFAEGQAKTQSICTQGPKKCIACTQMCRTAPIPVRKQG
jgi:hypothetical protein